MVVDVAGTPGHPPAWPAGALSFSTLNHCPLFGLDVDLLDQARAAARAGFELLSPDVFSLRARAARPGGIEELAGALDELGLGVLDIASLNLDPAAAGAGAGGGAGEANDLEEVVAFARALRPRYVLARIAGEVDAASAAALADAAGVLAAEGAAVVLEPSPISSVRSLAAGLDLLERADLGGAGLVVDSWHLFVAAGLTGGDGLADLAALDVDRIAYVQVADGHLPAAGLDSAGLMAATLGERALPGEGSFDLDALRDVLAVAGYRGPVCVEVMGSQLRTEPVETFAARCHDAARTVGFGPLTP